MTGYREYRVLKDLESMAKGVGFELTISEYVTVDEGRRLSLRPRMPNDGEETPLPIYNRDGRIYSGSAEELIAFLEGWQRSVAYLTSLGVVTKKRIQRKEQDYRNARLLAQLAAQEKPEEKNG